MNRRLFRGSAVPHLWAYFDADKGGAGASGDGKQSDDPKPENDADGGGKQPEGDGEKKFTQAEFEAALKSALDQKEKRAKKVADDAEEERKRKDAEAAGKWEEVNKSLVDENNSLKAERDGLLRQQMQTKVATTVGLPLQLADRLKGESEEEMTTDAKAILALLPKPDDSKKTPPPGNQNNPPPKGKAADLEEEKAAKAAHASITSRI